jgi:hypothetical protein
MEIGTAGLAGRARRLLRSGWMPRAVGVVIVSLAACLAACAARTPAAAPRGTAPRILETREGLASYYGKELQGRITEVLGFLQEGRVLVRLEVLAWGRR